MNVTDPVSGITFRWHCTASIAKSVMKLVWRGVSLRQFRVTASLLLAENHQP